MKILIINAYSKRNQAAFKRFENYIKQIFLRQKELLDTETEFFIRDLNNLDDFLYESDSIYVSPEAARLFNFLDMIFIQGESNLHPWSPKNFKLLILLKMCFLTKKNVFATASAMQCLVYLCATNFEKPINVINGVEGTKLEAFYQLHPETMSLSARDLVLDNVTGDFYTYSESSGQWLPIANAGLHSNKSAQSFNSIGKYIIKAPVYKPQPRLDKYGLFLQRHYETFCSIKKIHIQHWLLQNVEIEFVVATKSSWDVHPFNFVNPQRTFITLGEGPRGPLLIEIGDNIIASQFIIDEQYPETLKIFNNFIQNKLKAITNLKESSRLLIEKVSESSKTSYTDPLAAAKNEIQNNKQIRMLGTSRPKSGVSRKSSSQIIENMGSQIKIRPTSAKTFSHVGYSSKKTETLEIIDNNAILASNVININTNKQNPNQSLSLMTKNLGTTSCENFLKSEVDESFEMKKESKKKEIQSKVKSRPQTAKITKFWDLDEKSPQNQKDNINSLDNFRSNKNIPNKTLFEVRKMLHPEMKAENLPENKCLWVPGNLSKTKEDFKRIDSATSVGTMRSMKSSSIVLKPKYTLGQTLFSSYSKFKNIDLDECRRKPIIRNSAPYMIEQKMQKEKEMKDKTLNLGADKFDLGKPTNNYIPNYVNLTLSEPPLNHKFREEDKNRWVSKRNFLVCKVKNS